VKTAQAAKAAAEQDLKDNAASFGVPFNVTKLPDFADNTDAVILDGAGSLGGETISGRGIYLLRGTTFVGFNDLVRGKSAPSAADMKAEATTVLGRVQVHRGDNGWVSRRSLRACVTVLLGAGLAACCRRRRRPSDRRHADCSDRHLVVGHGVA
jgi:hypothetical protein